MISSGMSRDELPSATRSILSDEDLIARELERFACDGLFILVRSTGTSQQSLQAGVTPAFPPAKSGSKAGK